MKQKSRQQLWQEKRRTEGRCTTCSEPVWRLGASFCLKHAIQSRNYKRQHYGYKRRRMTPLYAAEAEAE